MDMIASIASTLARLILLPGNMVCQAIGIGNADNRDLVRMLVNSLVWIVIGIFALTLAV
ncbi:hypothetical protein N8E89_23130 (plasmid) [Phyllobacterium sp. A18/5-2]|uniref:hypothetical protein n=1 Tax=Phyllobacterium sp. A18/5-2 TaxID=2978392 RepID=UPI0021C8FE7E|nr:hypothetical protein [Phyllobacterium sp. A18/5-2]UXN66111.1 hypothetical protein N8E89_23130 [Phyllobacterium sp. A18/5-2]